MGNVRLVKLAGTKRSAPKGSKPLTKADVAQVADISVRLRPKTVSGELDKFVQDLSAKAPKDREYLTREEFEERYGAAQTDVDKVTAFAHQAGLTITAVHHSSRIVRMRGSVDSLRKAFGVKLAKFAPAAGQTYRVRSGAVSIPAALKDIVVGVHGLDNRPVARPHFQARAGVKPSAAGDTSLSVAQIAKAYNFPIGLDGAGQCIALIELNGIDQQGLPIHTGYAESDLKMFFAKNNLPYPDIKAFSVDHGANMPGKPKGADAEVALDIEVAGAIAPGAKIAVYFAPNTTDGFINAVKAAAQDKVLKPSVISISWGAPEMFDDKKQSDYMNALDEAIRDAAAVGVTVCIASGDSGSSGGADDGVPHAGFPASSPHALCCGGTKLVLANGSVKNEAVWNAAGSAGGGGVSDYFARPAYQNSSGVPAAPSGKIGRGLPDIAGNADPRTGYQIYLGTDVVFGGTSAVAPLMAGLVALVNQKLAKGGHKSAGQINEQIYGAGGAGALRDIVDGDNDAGGDLGLYSAKPGWDACTGLGVPDGAKLLALLT